MGGAVPQGRYPPAKDLLHDGWYASCVHAGGLPCYTSETLKRDPVHEQLEHSIVPFFSIMKS